MTLTSRRVRCRSTVGAPFASSHLTDVFTSQGLESVRGNNTTFQFGFFDPTGAVIDLTGVQSINLKIQPSQTVDGVLADQTVTTFDNTLTASKWADGSAQHVEFALTSAQMNLALGGATKLEMWLVLTAITIDGAEITLAGGTFTLHEDNNGSSATPPENPGSYLTIEQGDARYKIEISPALRYEIAQSLTEDEQRQGLANLGVGVMIDQNVLYVQEHATSGDMPPKAGRPDRPWPSIGAAIGSVYNNILAGAHYTIRLGTGSYSHSGTLFNGQLTIIGEGEDSTFLELIQYPASGSYTFPVYARLDFYYSRLATGDVAPESFDPFTLYNGNTPLATFSSDGANNTIQIPPGSTIVEMLDIIASIPGLYQNGDGTIGAGFNLGIDENAFLLVTEGYAPDSFSPAQSADSYKVALKNLAVTNLSAVGGEDGGSGSAGASGYIVIYGPCRVENVDVSGTYPGAIALYNCEYRSSYVYVGNSAGGGLTAYGCIDTDNLSS